jgi:hypothetical protein
MCSLSKNPLVATQRPYIRIGIGGVGVANRTTVITTNHQQWAKFRDNGEGVHNPPNSATYEMTTNSK